MAALLISSFRALRTVALTDIAHELKMDTRSARARMRRSPYYHGKGARHVYLLEDKPAIIDWLRGFPIETSGKSVHIRQITDDTGDDDGHEEADAAGKACSGDRADSGDDSSRTRH